MKSQLLIRVFKKQKFLVEAIDFSEDGYEIKLKVIQNKNEDISNPCELIRRNIEKLDLIKFKGLVMTEYTIENGRCVALLVPKSEEEMSNFIWTYAEKYGNGKKVSNVLSEAFAALENAIERIPENCKAEKEEALRNYDTFSRIIF